MVRDECRCGGAWADLAAGRVSRGRLSIETPQGDLVLNQTPGLFDTFFVSTAFDIHELSSSGYLSMVQSPKGWALYPGQVLGGAKISDPGACRSKFTVGRPSDDAPLTALPEDACSGKVGFEEIGRREGGHAPQWDSALTRPFARIDWRFGAGGPEVDGVRWLVDPFDQTGAPASGYVAPDRLEEPDPKCMAAHEGPGAAGMSLPASGL